MSARNPARCAAERVLLSGITGLGLLMVIAIPASAETMLLDPDQAFVQASQAYDDGDHARAIELYQQLLDAGYRDVAVQFNLGNAQYREGDLGQSILHYRRAWHRAPRDPDIAANLRYVQEQAKVVPVQDSRLRSLVLIFSTGKWAALAMASLWLTAGLFIASRWWPDRSGALRRPMAGALAVLLLAVIGLAQSTAFNRLQEAVVQVENQQAMYAPLAAAKPHFAVPPGTIVRVLDRSQGWLRISLDRQSGWIPEGSCTMVQESWEGT